MAIQSAFGRIRDRLLIIKDRVGSPELAKHLAGELANDIRQAYFASGLQEQTGAGLDAATFVGEPQKVALGWRVNVGDPARLGDPNESAPRGTLRDFFEDYPQAFAQAWKFIPSFYKEILAQSRRAGLYGGRGPTYANYMWVQERGNARAFVAPRHFMETGRRVWRARVGQLINTWYRRA